MKRSLRVLPVISRPGPSLDIDRIEVLDIAKSIENDLRSANLSLPEVIEQRQLYFRVSVVGNCNLRCPFCHNEGGPLSGSWQPELLEPFLAAAKSVGFTRIQYTGGEPLIHPRIGEFLALARKYFSDVGVTTNGTFLSEKLTALISSGLTRLHISLQAETLHSSNAHTWALPESLSNAILKSAAAGVTVRVNLPVQSDHLQLATEFLSDVRVLPLNINVFAILPNGPDGHSSDSHYLNSLRQIVESEAGSRSRLGIAPTVSFRAYASPTGIRCGACRAKASCTEQSRSLRLGVDSVLRPCLASRDWDSYIPPDIDSNNVEELMRRMTLVALDYQEIR